MARDDSRLYVIRSWCGSFGSLRTAMYEEYDGNEIVNVALLMC